MIPTTFEEWKNCIEQECKIPLTSEFARKRLAVYQQQDTPETQQFIRLYGREHYERVLSWFSMVS